MSEANSTTRKKKPQLEESKTAKTTQSYKKLDVMPSLKQQAA
jgi:hypothetical protein